MILYKIIINRHDPLNNREFYYIYLYITILSVLLIIVVTSVCTY